MTLPQTITTRSQTAKSDEVKPLKVAELVDSNITVDEVIELQKNDSTLTLLWNSIDSVSNKSCIKNFQIENGLHIE